MLGVSSTFLDFRLLKGVAIQPLLRVGVVLLRLMECDEYMSFLGFKTYTRV